MKHAFLTINGRKFPAPKRGLNIKTMTTVSDGRNEQNVFIGQRIGRDMQKIVNQLSNFVFNVTYLDPVSNDWVTRKMYVSDRDCQPYRVDPVTGKTTQYTSCKCSFVDVGV